MKESTLRLPSVATDDTTAHWYARLELQFQQSQRACRLSRCRHQGPLYVQKPFYPEGRDLAHVYVLHPPGGLVSGDCLQIDVDVTAKAHALITTPGAGRIYRARQDRTLQQQHINLKVAEGASLEWLPLETIVYRDANAKLSTQVDLADNSHFIGWEITSLGLPASGIKFDQGQLQQRLQINRNGQPVVIESQQLTESTQAIFNAVAGLQAKPVTGVLLAGPFSSAALSEQVMTQCRQLLTLEDSSCLAAISQVGDFVIARYIGSCSAQCRQLFIAVWSLLRPELLGRSACAPRIWAT